MSENKLKKWSVDNNGLKKEDMNLGNISLKNNPDITNKGDEMTRLIEVIQYVISDAFNNEEFRMFMIKRFLHNYLPQGTFSSNFKRF